MVFTSRFRQETAFKFPPAKSHFGKPIARHRPERLGILQSESFGGLTNYWGATMLPFTERELASWPINRTSLRPHFLEMARITGISGRRDALNRYFDEDFSNRPPLKVTEMLRRLDGVVNDSHGRGQYDLISGFNRCAVGNA